MTLPDLILYRIDGAVSLVAHMTLHELAIPFTGIRMTINPATRKAEAADGTLTSDEYAREINPTGQVPALSVIEHHDNQNTITTITETPAILMYLADLGASSFSSGTSLVGGNPLERAQIASWLAFLSTSVHCQAFGPLSFPRRFLDVGSLASQRGGGRIEEAEKAVVAAGKKSVDLYFRIIEERLPFSLSSSHGGGDDAHDSGEGEDEGYHAVGRSLSVVDFNLYVFYRWGRDMGVKMDELYPKWTALARKLEARGSVKTAVWLERVASVF